MSSILEQAIKQATKGDLGRYVKQNKDGSYSNTDVVGKITEQAKADYQSGKKAAPVSGLLISEADKRAEVQKQLDAAADAAKKAYEDFMKSSFNRQYQKTWGRQSEEARQLYQTYNTAMQERDAYANQSKLQNFVDIASGLRNNTAIQSEVDKQRAVNLGTSKSGDTLGQKGLPFLRNATTEAQRQQKMGYSTWDAEKYQAMSNDEAEVYNRLVKNGYEKEAQEFLDAIDSTLNYRVTKARTDTARQAAQDGFIGGAAASAGSTLLNILGTGAQAELAAIRAMRNDEAIDPYAEEMYGRNLSSTLRGTVSEEVGNWAATLPTVDTSLGAQSGRFTAMPIEQQQESNRKIAEFLYNTGMSMVDMVAMSPMGTTGMSLIMGTNAAADSLIDAKNRGLSDEQAMTISIISGAAEVIAEKYSLDRLFDGKIAVSSLKNALIQGGVEASEEAVTELANTLADVFVLGNQSAFEEAVTAYMDQGMDYQQAQNKAFVDVLADIAAAGAGGFLSGFTMGGAVDIVNTNAQGRSVIDQTAQTFIEQGQTPEQAQQSAIDYLKEELRAVGALADEGTVAYELSQRAGDMSTGDIGRAYLANRDAAKTGRITFPEETAPETPAQKIEAIDNQIAELDKRIAEAANVADLSKYGQTAEAMALDPSAHLYGDNGTLLNELQEQRRQLEQEREQVRREAEDRTAEAFARLREAEKAEAETKRLLEKTEDEASAEGRIAEAERTITDTRAQLKDIIYPQSKRAQILNERLAAAEAERAQAEGEQVEREIRTEELNALQADREQAEQDAINARDELEMLSLPQLEQRKAMLLERQENLHPESYEYAVVDEELDAIENQIKDITSEPASEETPQSIPEQIKELNKQLAALPFKDSVEGLRIQQEIQNLVEKRAQEIEQTKTGGIDVQDSIGGNEPVPDEVKNSMKDKKPQERRHEALKKRLNLDPDIANTIEAFVRQKIPPERVAVAMMDKVNSETVLEYYNSYKQMIDNSNAASDYRKSVLNKRYEAIKNAVGDTLWKWKDKKNGLAYSRMTQERIIREIAAEDPEAAVWITQNIFEPVHINEAARTRWANKYAERAKAHNMTENENEFVHILITERDLIQRLANVEERGRSEKEIKQLKEALDRVERDKAKLKERDSKLDESRCNTIADDFLAMYREIYEKLTGIQLKNGMPVTDFRSTYAPVVKDKKGRTVLSYLGIELETQELPTSIAGLTEFRKPGKPWFSHDLSRSVGYSTAYDMLGGLDEYLKSAGDVIFHTDDIQNVRMLENVIREATTPEGRAETLQDWIEQGITGEELNEKMQKEQLENSSLSNYVRNLREYGNLLANKKSSFDRGFENLLGRSLYRTMQNVKARITSNVLGGNISVVLSQAIPLTQAAGVISGKNLLRGIDEAGRAYAKDDGFNARSTFITNRIGYKNVAFKDTPQKVADAVAKPFDMVDEVVASAIVRGRYYDNLANGMSESAALKEADSFAAGLIADRSKGALPTIFGSKNPISTMLTMFQVEANNQMDFMFKDLKVEAEKKAPHAVGAFMSLALAKMFIAAFMYDEERKLLGLSANAFDPINWLRDASEEIRKGIDDEQSISETVGNIWDNTREQIPFIGGGRYGSIYENALPKFGNIADAIQAADEMEENGGKYVAQAALEELSKPVLYLGLPTGGAQLKKTAQGINALVQGESKAISKKGEEYVQYTVAPTLGNIAGGVLFGKSGLKENKEWKASGFTSFSDKERDAYNSLKTHGGSAAQFGKYRETYRAMVEADDEKNDALYARRDEILEGNPALTKAEALERAEMDLGYKVQNSALKWAQQITRDNSLTDDQKADLVLMSDISASSVEDIKALTNFGVPVSDYVNIMTNLAEMGLSIGDSSVTADVKKQLSQQIYEMDLSVEQKTALARKTIGDDWIVDYSSQAAHELTIIGKSAYNDWQEAKAAYGVSADAYLKYYQEKDTVKGDLIPGTTDKYVSNSKKAKLVNLIESLDAPEAFKEYVWYKVYEKDYSTRFNGIKQIDGVWQPD